MINRSKKTLRSEYKALRNSVTDREVKSDKIYQLLTDSNFYNDADTVLLYWSVGSEVITHRMIDKVLSDGKKLALPKCIDAFGNMLFYYVSSADELIDGMYGIKEPAGDKPYDVSHMRSLCIVPGLSFSTAGYRLGYGKGYYDRFLENFKGVSIGLCYEECMTQFLPTDGYDKQVNYIITNKSIYDIK